MSCYQHLIFTGRIKWTKFLLVVDDYFALESSNVKLHGDEINFACLAEFHQLFTLTSEWLYRIEFNEFCSYYELSVKNFEHGWQKAANDKMELQRGRINLHVVNRFSNLGIVVNNYEDGTKMHTSTEEKRAAILCCTDTEAFLTVNSPNGCKLLRVFNVRKNEIDVPVLMQLNFDNDTWITEMVAGKAHVAILDNNGQVHTFGIGSRGELGHGDTVSESQPKLVHILQEQTIVQIAAGGWHTVALTVNGDVYAWGWNKNGQLGIKPSSLGLFAVPFPIDLTDDCRVTQVCCGSRHTLLLTADGRCYGCGTIKYGQLDDKEEDTFVDKNGLFYLGAAISNIDAFGWSNAITSAETPSEIYNHSN